MDIRLEDSDHFAILAKRRVDSPFVFCTAYSDYALQAFAANSIDYLLKPVVRKDLSRALRKYQRFSGFRMVSGDWLEFPAEGAANGKRVTYRKQFLVALAGQFTQVRSADVVAVGSYLKGRQLIDKSGRQWVLDAALEEAERALHPDEFCRICRQWLVRLSPVSSLVRTADEYKVAVTGLAAPVNV